MSHNIPTPDADERRPRSFLKIVMNAFIFGFFLVGVVVAAGSFGLFGCWCTEGFVRREKPTDAPPMKLDVPPAKGGEFPPLPPPPK